MTRTINLRPDAQAEFDDGVDYLDALRPGLGANLAHAVQQVLARLAVNPRFGTEVLPGVRRVLLPGTKYCVVYLADDTTHDVISVFHTSRDPAIWRGRI